MKSLIIAFFSVFTFLQMVFCQNHPPYRLSKDFDPQKYEISIRIDRTVDGFILSGNVNIYLKTLVNTTTILLHARKISIENISIIEISTKHPIPLKSANLITKYDFLQLNFGQTLTENSIYRVKIIYKSVLSDEMHGFFKSFYIENGTEKWLALTHLEPVGARKLFPCFDEPSFKSKFDLRVTRPSYMNTTLSNMPIRQQIISGNTTTDIFYETPKMSTYLLALIVSQLSSQNSSERIKVWSRPEVVSQTKYAHKSSEKILSKMNEYFNISYYDSNKNMKLDLVAVPDFSPLAMENWGLPIFRELVLLCDEKESPDYYKQGVYTTITHELSHQWFGNLVTCSWWSHIWLNEGFARYFQYEFSESMDLDDQFVIAETQNAFIEDAKDKSTPLTNTNVNSPKEIKDHFGIITYSKGAAILKMVKYWIGEDTFRRGLQLYLNSDKYGVKTPDDLFKSLQMAADENRSIKQYNITVKQLMDSWTLQNGFPLISVKIDQNTGDVTLKQQKYKHRNSNATNQLYNIPITFTNNTELDFENTEPNLILTKQSVILRTLCPKFGYIILNKKARGYYRINYDDYSWSLIKHTLIYEINKIHRLNRAQIIDDLFNFALNDIVPYSQMFDITEFLKNETEYAPWMAAYNLFDFFRMRFVQESDVLNLINRHLLNLMKTVVETLGFDEKANEKHITKILRSSTLQMACELGHKKCIENSIYHFKRLMNMKKPVPPNFRERVYCDALRYGSDQEYDFLWNKFIQTNIISEQIIIMNSLGCTRQTEKLKEFLNLSLQENSPIKYNGMAFASVLNGNTKNADLVLKFIKTNWSKLNYRFSTNELTDIIDILATNLSLDQINELESFLISFSGNKKYLHIMDKARENRKWVVDNKMNFSKWLIEKYLIV